MAHLDADENFPLPVFIALRRLGHDVVTALQAGQANRRIPDDLVLAYAAALGRAVLTINRQDFMRLHRRNPEHAGIILCTRDLDAIGQAGRIDAEIGGKSSLAGQLVRVYRPS